jgi:hypothetical protein
LIIFHAALHRFGKPARFLLASERCSEDTIVPMPTPNTLFALVQVSNPEALRAKLQEIAPWVWYELQDSQWLIVAPSATTSKEVSDRLGLTGGGLAGSTGIVLRVENYFGWSYQTVWEWISTKLGAELVPTPV